MNQDIILPAQVTGLYATGKEQSPEPKMTIRMKEAFESMRNLMPNSEFSRFYAHTEERDINFSTFLVRFPNRSDFLQILCNKYFPLMACAIVSQAEYESGSFKLPPHRFTEIPLEPEEFFPSSRWEGLSVDFLNLRADSDNERFVRAVSRLTFTEFAFFTYKEPRCIGEIIFNKWA